jgi:hypothetical protein
MPMNINSAPIPPMVLLDSSVIRFLLLFLSSHLE